jgi:cystathionine gamma-lyase
MMPIYQTSTYAQESPGKHKGFEYARTQNPTRSALERNLAALENGKYAVTFGSGLAAMDAVIRCSTRATRSSRPTTSTVARTAKWSKVHERYGIKSHFVDFAEPEQVAAAINERTKLIWIETPTNPMLKLVDIRAITKLAKKHIRSPPAWTTPSPVPTSKIHWIWVRTWCLHSATKYLGGHSDVVMGAVIVKRKVLGGGTLLPAERRGRCAGPTGLLSDAARHQNPPPARGALLQECA